MIGVRIQQTGELDLEGMYRATKRPVALRKVMGTEAANAVKDNFRRLAARPNKLRAPSTGYWRDAANGTTWELTGGGRTVLVTINQIGVGLHLRGTADMPGGVMKPVRAEVLTVPVHPDAHGKSPREFDDLEIVYGGNAVGLGRPKAGSAFLEWMYVFRDSVRIRPNPEVLPSDAEMNKRLMRRGQRFLDREFARNQNRPGANGP